MRTFLLMLILGFTFIFADTAAAITETDELYHAGKYNEALSKLDKLLVSNPDDVEVLWRVGRAHFDIADQTDDEEIHKKHFYPGFEAAKKALELNPDSAPANHWYAVLIGKIGMLEGTKQKIINSYDVQKYALRAIELDPTYDGTYHVMGRWHYELANLSWVERKVAGLVYSTPPEGTFEEAAEYFNKAIQAKPDEVRHYLWLAKAQIEMDKTSDARKTLNEAIKLKPFDDGDRNMQKEARELLGDL